MPTALGDAMDADLVRRATRGDNAAFEALLSDVSDSMFGVARRILGDGDLARDALQSALLTIWRKLPHLREPEAFEAWAYRILVNACYAEAPRAERWRTIVRVLPLEQPARHDEIGLVSDRDELDRAFRRLPLDQRSVVVLHLYVGLPLVDVARSLGIPQGTARSRLHYALRSLRSEFGDARHESHLQEGRPA